MNDDLTSDIQNASFDMPSAACQPKKRSKMYDMGGFLQLQAIQSRLPKIPFKSGPCILGRRLRIHLYIYFLTFSLPEETEYDKCIDG